MGTYTATPLLLKQALTNPEYEGVCATYVGYVPRTLYAFVGGSTSLKTKTMGKHYMNVI
jgi:hypothetical protein